MNPPPPSPDATGSEAEAHEWSPRADPPTPWPAWAEKLLSRAGSAFLGIASGMTIAMLLGILLVHRFAIGACFVAGILCVTLYSMAFGKGPLKAERAAFRPIAFTIAAIGFLALDAGIIWMIMQVAWR